MLNGFRILVFVVMILFLLIPSVFSADRVYWDETADTIYVSSFPARVDLHMRFDCDDTLSVMLNPFTWASSFGVDSLIQKSCNTSGWFARSDLNVFNYKTCGFDSPDKQFLFGSIFGDPQPSAPGPGIGHLLAVWSFMIGEENAVLCMDSTFMEPSRRLKWVRYNEGIGVYPEYTKKCWVIAKKPFCGDANLDWVVDIVDMVYLINYFFYNGSSPKAPCDVNGDGMVDIVDILQLGNYLFHGADEPACQPPSPRIYFDEKKDTIYLSNFPGNVNLHMRFDTPETLITMISPFTWAGSSAGISLVTKSCDSLGWFFGSEMNVFDIKFCGADGTDKYHLTAAGFLNPNALIKPGQGYLLTTWTFNVETDNSTLCLDSTTATPPSTYYLYWRNTKNTTIIPNYSKKCWTIAKTPVGKGE